MPIPVTCAKCGFEIQAPNHVAGRTLRCFKCLTPFTVPKAAPVVDFTPIPAPMAVFPDSPPAPKPPEPAPEFELDAEAILLEPDDKPVPTDEPVVEDVAVLEEDLEVVDADDIILEEDSVPPPADKKKKK
jgi:hypothetical protein